MPTERLAILRLALRLYEEIYGQPAALADSADQPSPDLDPSILDGDLLRQTVSRWEGGICVEWRRQKMRLDGERQVLEIERHKYLLSKDKGFDVGWEAAARDWVLKYAATWRAWWETQDEAVPPVPATP